MNVIPLDDPIEPPGTGSTFRMLVAALAEERKRHAVAQAEAHKLEARVNAIRAKILDYMETTGMKTGEAHGLQVQLKTRKGQTITDEIELLAAITEVGMLDDFTRFDKAAAARYAAENDLPGVEVTVTAHISVSEVAS